MPAVYVNVGLRKRIEPLVDRETAPERQRPPKGWRQKGRPNRAFVYFIQTESGDIKIGIAENPIWRLERIQDYHPRPLKLLLIVAGNTDLERALHLRFEKLNLRGEWFRGEAELMVWIEEVRRLTAWGEPIEL